MGIDGAFIKFVYPKAVEDDDPMEDGQFDTMPLKKDNIWDDIRYSIDPTMDPSVRHLVEKILPLATYYISVNAFVEQYSRFEYGTINHALCSGMHVFLKEYLTFVAQLEHQFQTSTTFTLQRFWFYAQETLQDMSILHSLTMKIRNLSQQDDSNRMEEDLDAVLEELVGDNKSDEVHIPEWQKGGAILNVLADRLVGLSGNPKCKKIYSFLLACASAPYSHILNLWIYRGEINDTYNEFMIVEKKSIKKETLKEDFNDSYWETRYSIREGQVPRFLEPLMTQILLAGKYLNVVRECGVNISKPEEMEDAIMERYTKDGQDVLMEDGHSNRSSMSHTRDTVSRTSMEQAYVPTRNDVWAAVDGGRFVKNLDIAYRYANHTLLNLLLKEQQLIARLRSLKHYFFLDQSDFLTSFLDLARDELKQPAKDISLTRLQSLMDLVLRNPSSVAAYDPFKEDVKISMSSHRLIDQLLRVINVAGMDSLPTEMFPGSKNHRWTLGSGHIDTAPQTHLPERSQSMAGGVMGGVQNVLTGYEAFTLDYTVTFPLSLVISRKALTKYQLLFRHLLYLKHVEESLCAKWMDQKHARWRQTSRNPDIEAWKYRIYSLRTRMLAFVQQFAYYIANEVLEPNWARLETNLTKASTVDQVLQYHSDFLDECLKECMLTNAKLLKIYNKLTGYCTYFTKLAEQFNEILNQLEDQQVNVLGVPKGGVGAKSTLAASLENSNLTLAKIEDAFLFHIGLLIEALNYYSATETVQFLSLVVRIDYNLFYKANTGRDRRSDRNPV
ncbi:Spc98 family-domain-containing protein [Phycomyces nitens]|nr:Spc98 family-domain-containing protein [Phycomyces nitens]